jgi:hypothetical protein
VSGGFSSGGGGFDDGGRVEGGEKVVSGGLWGGHEAESRDETLSGDGVGAKLLSDGLNERRGTWHGVETVSSEDLRSGGSGGFEGDVGGEYA